jgi:thermitase
MKYPMAAGGIPSSPGFIPEFPSVLPERNNVPRYATDHFLVKLKADIFRDTYIQGESLGMANIDILNQQHGITRVQRLILDGTNVQLKESHGLSRIFVFHVPPNTDVRQVVEEYSKDPKVEYAEPDYFVFALRTPNDPDFSQQWSLNNTGQTGGKIDADIDAPEAWDIATGTNSVKIAIVDTGVDLDHPDLSGKLTAGYDFVNNDSIPQDDNGHGTHVAGTASAVTNNGVGVAGVCWGCSIMPVKVLDASGSGTDSQVASGIIWAADQGARVINLSLGGYGAVKVMSDAVAYAYNLGAVVVAARGNDGNSTPHYPAAYPQVISVGATDHNDKRPWFSSYGPDLEVAAPGDNILSSYWDNIYATGSGTSMATPHVSGLAGLLLSLNPALTQDNVRSILKHTADDLVGNPTEGQRRF